MNDDQPTSKLPLMMSIALPLLLLGAVGLFELYARIKIEPPQYDVLYAIHSSEYLEGHCRTTNMMAEAKSKNERVMIEFRPTTSRACFSFPRFFRFSPHTGENTEILINQDIWPSGGDKQLLPVPEFEGYELKLGQSPDGYDFDIGTYRNRPSFLFFQDHQRKTPISLSKDGRRIQVPLISDMSYYYGGSITFLGWVLK